MNCLQVEQVQEEGIVVGGLEFFLLKRHCGGYDGSLRISDAHPVVRFMK